MQTYFAVTRELLRAFLSQQAGRQTSQGSVQLSSNHVEEKHKQCNRRVRSIKRQMAHTSCLVGTRAILQKGQEGVKSEGRRLQGESTPARLNKTIHENKGKDEGHTDRLRRPQRQVSLLLATAAAPKVPMSTILCPSARHDNAIESRTTVTFDALR